MGTWRDSTVRLPWLALQWTSIFRFLCQWLFLVPPGGSPGVASWGRCLFLNFSIVCASLPGGVFIHLLKAELHECVHALPNCYCSQQAPTYDLFLAVLRFRQGLNKFRSIRSLAQSFNSFPMLKLGVEGFLMIMWCCVRGWACGAREYQIFPLVSIRLFSYLLEVSQLVSGLLIENLCIFAESLCPWWEGD